MNQDFDIIINLVSLDHHKSQLNPDLVSSINVLPTWNLLERFTKKKLNKFIYFSTTQVYGDLSSESITENKSMNPINYYGLTHSLSEIICNYFNSNSSTECINIRLSNGYGSPVLKNNNCWDLAINNFCKTAVENGKIIIKSDGTPMRDFIHLSDIEKAIEVIIESKKIFEKYI